MTDYGSKREVTPGLVQHPSLKIQVQCFFPWEPIFRKSPLVRSKGSVPSALPHAWSTEEEGPAASLSNNSLFFGCPVISHISSKCLLSKAAAATSLVMGAEGTMQTFTCYL